MPSDHSQNARVGAVLDIGTNAVRLLVARLLPGDTIEVLQEARELTFFGRAISATGELLKSKARPTLFAVADFIQQAHSAGAEIICLVATAAARRLRQPQHDLEALFAQPEVIPKVLEPEAEARLTFLGATTGLPPTYKRVCTIDIGGGSTEVAFGEAGNPRTVRSLELGSQTATDIFVASYPPTRVEYRNLLQALRATLPRLLAGIPRSDLECFATGGTFNTLAACALELAHFDREQVVRLHLSLHRIQVLRRRMQQLPLEEVAALPGIEPARAGLMWAGAVLAEEFMKELRLQRVRLARHGLRMGVFRAYCAGELGETST